jgi:hypothetical protein
MQEPLQAPQRAPNIYFEIFNGPWINADSAAKKIALINRTRRTINLIKSLAEKTKKKYLGIFRSSLTKVGEQAARINLPKVLSDHGLELLTPVSSYLTGGRFNIIPIDKTPFTFDELNQVNIQDLSDLEYKFNFGAFSVPQDIIKACSKIFSNIDSNTRPISQYFINGVDSNEYFSMYALYLNSLMKSVDLVMKEIGMKVQQRAKKGGRKGTTKKKNTKSRRRANKKYTRKHKR